MVARNRSDPMPIEGKDHFYAGAKQAGFSRLPRELFANNKHAGLYACKIFKKNIKRSKPNLQEVRSHFAKARKVNSNQQAKAKVQNVRPFSAHKTVRPFVDSTVSNRETKCDSFSKSSEFFSKNRKRSHSKASRLILKQKVLNEASNLISVSRKRSGTNRTQRPNPKNSSSRPTRTTAVLRRARKSFPKNRNFKIKQFKKQEYFKNLAKSQHTVPRSNTPI